MENELHNPQGEHPVPKKKPAKRNKRRAVARTRPAPKLAPSPAGDYPQLEGLTQSDCCFDCDPVKGCVITGSICGHPHKGGLQSALLNKPDVVRVYNAARRIISRQITDKKS